MNGITPRRVGKGAVAIATALVAVGLWGAFAVTQLGYAWPYPLVLPDTISFPSGGCFVEYQTNASGY